MGRTNRERRADKRRREAERRGRRPDASESAAGDPGRPGDRPSPPGVEQLIAAGAPLSLTRTADIVPIVAALVASGTPGGEPGALAGESIGGHLTRALASLWEHGWQPLDVVHVARRLGNGRAGRLAERVVLVEAAATGAFDRAPDDWVAQLRSLPAKAAGSTANRAVAHWRDTEDLDAHDAVLDALRLLGVLRSRPALGMLLPPPSRWHEPGAQHSPGGAASSHGADGADPKMLSRIRALLAKAEATTFPEEADTFTAKAQELMARHAIDHAVLRAAAPGSPGAPVRGRRVHVNDPYAEAKVQLLSVVARANAGRAVWDRTHGFATVMAHAADLELIDVLFTSLLVQATHAAANAGRAAGRTRATAFRRAFLTAYAVRVGDRLDGARRQVQDEAVARHGAALVPLLAQRETAVDEAVRAAFPRLETRAARPLDAQGWYAGELAADLAELGTDRPRLRR